MNKWNVGDKAKTVDGECTVMALNDCVTAIQYAENGRIEIVGFDELFSPADEQALKEMAKLYQDGMGPDEFCEMLYLAGYRKQPEQPTEDMTDPANWRLGDWLECTYGARNLTVGEIYQVINFWDGKPVIDDDADYGITRNASFFRFHSRP